MKFFMSFCLFLLSSMFVGKNYADFFSILPIEAGNESEENSKLVFKIFVEKSALISDHIYIVDYKKANVLLKISFIKLESSYFIKVVKLVDGNPVNSHQTKLDNLDELDSVSFRLMDSILNNKDFENNISIGNVTQQDHLNQQRVRSIRHWSFSFGPSLLKTNRIHQSFSYTLGYSADVNSADNLGLFFFHSFALKNGKQDAISGFLVGLEHMFSSYNAAPFVLGRLGYGGGRYHYLSGDAHGDSGLIFQLGSGYKFFRTSDVNMHISLIGSMVNLPNFEKNFFDVSFQAGLLF